MPSLFADQFNYQTPYGLQTLKTAAPKFSLRLPESNPGDEPADEPSSTSNTSSEGAQATANANASVLQHVSHQAGINANANAGASQGANQNFSAMIDAPAKVAASNTAAAPAAQPGIWDQVTNGVASGFDAARHGIATGADAVNGVATNQYVHDVMNFGNALPDNGGLVGMIHPGQASTAAPSAQQDIKVNSMRLNQGSPQYDVESPQYSAMPRGLSANGGFNSAQSVESSPVRAAIEAPSSMADPLQSMIDQPSYSAMPRGWGANGGFSSNQSLNPQQFFDQSGSGSASGAGSAASDAGSAAVPRGWSGNGGWESDLGKVLGDLGDAL